MGLSFLASCTQTSQPNEAIEAISTRSMLVVQVNHASALQKQINASVSGSVVAQSFLLPTFYEALAGIEKWLGKMPETFCAGFEQSGASTYGWLFAVSEHEISVVEIMDTWELSQAKTYSTTKIYRLQANQKTLFVSRLKGLILASAHDGLVENAIRQLEAGTGLKADETFTSLLNTANTKDPLNILVQHKYAESWLEMHFGKGLTWPVHFTTWSALDSGFDEQTMIFSGLCDAADSSAGYLSTFANTGSGSSTCDEIIPQNAALVVIHTCGNVGNWHKNFEKYLGLQNRQKKRNIALEEEKVMPEDWLAWMDEEWGVFYTDGTTELHQRKFGFIRTKNKEQAIETLVGISESVPVDYRGYNIYTMQKRNILPLMYGRLFSYMSQPAWFSHGNWLIFTPDAESARSLINSLSTDKTWSNGSPIEKTLRKKDQHIAVYAINPEWLDMAQFELTGSAKKSLAAERDMLDAISCVAIHFKVKNKMAYAEVVLSESANTPVQAKEYFNTKLEAAVAAGPFYVVNHNNQQGEIVVQDANHTLYLIGSTGSILWKKKLDEPILGEVSQIDIYKNNKLQLAFTTPSKFYVLDRNGNDVMPFPIKLPAKATAAAGIVDYEKNRNYRILIPCGKKVYNYALDGNPVKGWLFGGAAADVVTTPNHAVNGGKDYIYFADASGHVYLIDRKGEKRTTLNPKLGAIADGSLFLTLVNNEPVLQSLGASGFMRTLTLAGELDSVQSFRQKPNAMRVLGSTTAYASENYLFVRSENLNLNIELDESVTSAPVIYTSSSELYFGISTSNSTVWLFDQKGNVLPGMPLFGAGVPLLGNLAGSETMAIVASPDGAILAYKLGR